MGVVRVDKKFEEKLRRIHEQLQREYPKRTVSVAKITAIIDINEEEIRKKMLNKRKRRNRYVY